MRSPLFFVLSFLSLWACVASLEGDGGVNTYVHVISSTKDVSSQGQQVLIRNTATNKYVRLDKGKLSAKAPDSLHATVFNLVTMKGGWALQALRPGTEQDLMWVSVNLTANRLMKDAEIFTPTFTESSWFLESRSNNLAVQADRKGSMSVSEMDGYGEWIFEVYTPSAAVGLFDDFPMTFNKFYSGFGHVYNSGEETIQGPWDPKVADRKIVKRCADACNKNGAYTFEVRLQREGWFCSTFTSSEAKSFVPNRNVLRAYAYDY